MSTEKQNGVYPPMKIHRACRIICCRGPQGPAGPVGPPGQKGDPGEPGNLNDTALSFSYKQLANLIEQIIKYYPNTIIRVYATGFSGAALEGTPKALFKSPDATYGGLFVIQDETDTGVVPLNNISAIVINNGVYNNNITYLSKPKFPQGYDTNIITSMHDYLLPYSNATVTGNIFPSATGVILKNEYGIVVIADDTQGNNPTFFPVFNITTVVAT